MSYADVNTPVIERITLPSGNTYYIADREIRDVVDALSQTVAGGVSFIIAWDGTDTPAVAQIPQGVKVIYNNIEYTGTLSAETSGSGAHAQAGAFYLVKSATSAGNKDVYDEYVPVGAEGSKSWEKIGDTIVDLSDIVTGVSLTKQTDTVIGTDATFTITQPSVALSTDATAGDGVISVATGITNVTNPSVALSEQSTTATGRVAYTKSVSTTKISASASGGAVSASGDSVTALTGLGTPTTSNVASSVTPTTKKLATTTVTGVSGSTTPNVVKSRTSQTTADGTGTASTTNTDWLKGVSVSNGVLTIGAATLDTQTTYSAGEPSSITIPTAAGSATTVATGAVTTTGSGADVVTDVAVGDTVAAVTGYASPITDTVLGTASTFNVTNPSITIASGSTGDVTVATGGTTKYMAATASGTEVTPATTNIKATASGANTAWNNKDSVTVLKSTTDVSVTKGSV